MMNHLFVYGTLAPGRENAHVLADIDGTWQPASIRGTLYQKGWGAALGYPGIKLDTRAGPVEGQVFSADSLADHWPRLDEFEGEGYRRRRTTATLADGRPLEVYVYELSSTPADN